MWLVFQLPHLSKVGIYASAKSLLHNHKALWNTMPTLPLLFRTTDWLLFCNSFWIYQWENNIYCLSIKDNNIYQYNDSQMSADPWTESAIVTDVGECERKWKNQTLGAQAQA